MTTEQPSAEGAQDEALKLADVLERDLCDYPCEAVALVLRRLHADNKALRARVQELERELGHAEMAAEAEAKCADERCTKAAATEREACERVCQAQMNRWGDARARYVAGECAAAIRARGARLPSAPLRSPACWCEACDTTANNGWRTRMSLCPQCGDKRCPRAEQHDNPCRARGAQGESK